MESFYYYCIMAIKPAGRTTGSKHLSESEKNVIIETINEYAPLNNHLLIMIMKF